MSELGVSTSTRSRVGVHTVAREALAGFVGAIVLITNIVSFSALMFPGALAAGASTALWAMLIGSGTVGLWVAWKTTLPPIATGMDSPTGAVLVLIAATAGQVVLSSGGTPPQAIQATLLLFTVATAVSGALLFGLGAAGWGSYLRFVPFFVIAGFLGATGWLLIVGGIRMTTGHGLGDLPSAAGTDLLKLSCALLVCGVLLALRRWVRWPLALPVSLIAMALIGAALLRLLGLSDPVHGWYLPSLGTLTPWVPLRAVHAEPLPLATALHFVPEMLAVAIVSLVSLVTKISSLEVARKTSSDLDVELRAHGLAALMAAPLGGIAGSLQMGTSRLLENAGGATRWAGTACALVLAVVGLLSLDLPALIPLPIAAGLVFQLGWGFLVEACAKPLAQRDWLNLTLAVVISAACVRVGYVAGIIGGVVCACLLFAVNYARVGVVRQHLSRATFEGNVTRGAEASRYLGEAGEAIQIYWLSGYIFFGSSEGVFERVRRDIRALPARRVGHVILDFGMVAGADASATVSLAKLRNFCSKHSAALIFSGVTPRLRSALERDGFFHGKDAQPPFPDVTAALAWAEDALLAQGGLALRPEGADAAGVEAWLQQQFGAAARVTDFLPYLERRSFSDAQVLYRQGEAADAIDLVVCGRLSVDVAADNAPAVRLRLRSITTQTVIGEMGFFSHAARSATVTAEGPATVLTLTRSSFEHLRRERPDAAAAFYEFLLRTLSDRIRLTERMILALRP